MMEIIRRLRAVNFVLITRISYGKVLITDLAVYITL